MNDLKKKNKILLDVKFEYASSNSIRFLFLKKHWSKISQKQIGLWFELYLLGTLFVFKKKKNTMCLIIFTPQILWPFYTNFTLCHIPTFVIVPLCELQIQFWVWPEFFSFKICFIFSGVKESFKEKWNIR